MADGEIERPSILESVTRAALGSVPVFGPAFVEAYAYTLEELRWRTRQVGEAIAAECDDPALMLQRLRSDPRLATMLVSAVEAGKRSSREYKRIAMGRVVGQAFMDDAVIDDHAALLAALEDLEAPHFRLIAELEVATRETMPNLKEPYFSTLRSNGLTSSVLGENGRPGGLSEFGATMLQWVRDAATDPKERTDLDADPPS